MDEQIFIAFDESGNTGSNLLDKDQPVFVLASVRLTINQALELKGLIEASSVELKFNRLKKHYKFHPQIISLLNHELITKDAVQLAIFHKDYCISAYTVDRIIEPLAYNDKFDFYENGLNIAFTNLLHYYTPVFCDKLIWGKYKVDFINLFQNRDKESVYQFYSTVQSLIESSKSSKYASLLTPIFASQRIISDILSDWDKNNFDFTLSGFINLIDYWGRKSENNFYAYVDNSKPLMHFKYLVDNVRSIYIEQQEVGADRRTYQLPLKLIDIKFEDSKQNTVVQIADLIAGAANHYYRALADNRFRDELSEKIGETNLVNLVHSPVWPHKSFTPEELDTVHNGKKNILDSLVDLFYRPGGNIFIF